MSDGALSPLVGVGRVLTVLVADDEPDILMLMTRQLQRVGYHVINATDGMAALEMAKLHLPDLAVLDVQMPKMSGIDVLESLRSEPATSHIPVILLSAGFAEHTVRRGLEAGAEDYLRKPLAGHELADQVARAVGRAA